MDETETILVERAKTHGDFSEHAKVTGAIKRAMALGEKWNSLSDEQQESLSMIAHKMGRIIAGNPSVKDHWMDISGYAILVAKRCPT